MGKLQERKIKARTGGKITKVKNPQRAQRPDATHSIKETQPKTCGEGESTAEESQEA